MAGIGFELRRLYRQNNLSGLVKTYVSASLASTGPWLFTVLALGGITTFAIKATTFDALIDFKSIVIYNFCFSLVLSSPIFMVLTRYVSDCIHRKDVSTVPGVMLGALALFLAIGLPLAGAFYFFWAHLSTAMAISAVIDFLLIGMIWIVTVFLSALKDYRSITFAFLAGMLAAAAAACGLAHPFGAAGMLNGFSIGLDITLTVLIVCIYKEYRYPLRQPFAFLPYFRKYWEIGLGGLIYNSAIWGDKWIMWMSPNAQILPNGLVTYPSYDSAMFLAYLTITPSMAMFLFHVETDFFEHYLRFYRDIQNKATYAKLVRNHKAITASVLGSAGHLFLLQSCICVMAILAAPAIIGWLDGDYMQIGIFRYGVLGALFHVMMLFMFILLSYFDSRRQALLIYVFFLIANVSFTWGSVYLGFSYYGYGYFLASFVTFLLAAVLTARHLFRLPYHTFITANTSI